jgi:hypothetical protein
MEVVTCEVDDSARAVEEVRAAVARCRAQGAELRLVGVVRTSRLDAPQPSCGERVRRSKLVRHRVEQAERIARDARVPVTASLDTRAQVKRARPGAERAGVRAFPWSNALRRSAVAD